MLKKELLVYNDDKGNRRWFEKKQAKAYFTLSNYLIIFSSLMIQQLDKHPTTLFYPHHT